MKTLTALLCVAPIFAADAPKDLSKVISLEERFKAVKDRGEYFRLTADIQEKIEQRKKVQETFNAESTVLQAKCQAAGGVLDAESLSCNAPAPVPQEKK